MVIKDFQTYQVDEILISAEVCDDLRVLIDRIGTSCEQQLNNVQTILMSHEFAEVLRLLASGWLHEECSV